MFLIIALSFEDLVYPFFKFNLYNAFVLIFIFLTALSQILIFSRINEENVIQRKLALGFCIFKITYGIILKIIQTVLFYTNITERSVQFIVSIDIIIVSFVMIYLSYKDFKNFGSGLKEVLKTGLNRMSINE